VTDIWFDLLHARADITLSLGLVLAIAVTIHILLRKREVASAVGWIGLVWFAPIFGAVVYVMFGVNRVRRRARKLRPVDDDPSDDFDPPAGIHDGFAALELGVRRITGYPLLGGTRVQTFRDGDEAYPPMLAAIGDARTSICLSSYIFDDDQWGGRFIDALTQASRRGVAVRVLIDGIGGGWLLSRVYRRLRRNGVPAARFMHSLLPWRMPFVNLRSHKKILVIDGAVGFTGGMNISDDNVMATQPRWPVQDLHFRLEGPVVRQLVGAFAQDWQFTTGEDLEGPAWFPEIQAGDGLPARVIDAGPDEDLEKIEFAILEAIACAHTSIVVMTPYFLPDERMITALSLAAMRGVAVDVVVPEKTDHRFVDWALRANSGPLLQNDVRLWLSPPPFHHTKLMVVDGTWSLIGSSNWDIRSFRLNFELCAELYDPAVSATLTGIMDRNRGRRLTQEALDSRALPLRIRDAGARLLLPYL
jgi:cardiolipin synthase